jgi:hypothetical protein
VSVSYTNARRSNAKQAAEIVTAQIAPLFVLLSTQIVLALAWDI